MAKFPLIISIVTAVGAVGLYYWVSRGSVYCRP